MDLAGKKVLLTGGSDGIGKTLAFQLRTKGAEVVLTGRSPDKLAAMEAAGFKTIEADFSHPGGVEAVIAHWGERPLDILINNAGMGRDHDFRSGSLDTQDIEANIHANLTAPILLGAKLFDNLKRADQPIIVNVTSGLAITPSASAPLYCATKAGLRSYSIGVREQLRECGIHLLEALPPMVDTQMTSGREGKKITPEECAAAIVYAIESRQDEVYIGQVGLLKRIHSLSPKLAQKILLRF